MRIVVDRDACMGYANCVIESPDLFDVDEDDKVVLLIDDPDESFREAAVRAARVCPAVALRVED